MHLFLNIASERCNYTVTVAHSKFSTSKGDALFKQSKIVQNFNFTFVKSPLNLLTVIKL